MQETEVPPRANGRPDCTGVVLVLSVAANLLVAYALSVFGSQMYPFFFLLYTWIAVYVLLIVALTRWQQSTDRPLISRRFHLAGVLILTAGARLIFIGMTHNISLDPLWYSDFGTFMQMGEIPYVGFYFPYPPVFAYFIYALTSFATGPVVFRLFAIAMDCAIIIVLWGIVEKIRDRRWASVVIIAYALLPMSILESGWNGHFESLVNVFVLLSVWFWLRRNDSMSGAFLGISVATKVYPFVLFPILFAFIEGRERRIWFTISTVVAGALTFLPVLLVAWSGSQAESIIMGLSGFFMGLFQSVTGFLQALPLPLAILAIVIVLSILGSTVYLLRGTRGTQSISYEQTLISATTALGVILVAVGVIAAIYPILPISRTVYWRFPVDVGIVRGAAAASIGLLVLRQTRTNQKQPPAVQVSKEDLLVLMSATALLLVAMARTFFYGWYLLWSVPFFLMLRNRRLGYTLVLCLLLVYPNYSQDTFANLGIEEQRFWQDNFDTVEEWTTIVRSGDANASQISAQMISVTNDAYVWFDTSRIENESLLAGVSFSFVRNTLFNFSDSTDFAARIAASWDPTFGRFADLSLTFQGQDQHGSDINGTIIPKTSIFTNLTAILWKSAFTYTGVSSPAGTVTHLNLTIFPVQRVNASYSIDILYTTYGGLLNPVYLITIPSLATIVLVGCVVLYYGLGLGGRREQLLVHQSSPPR